MKVSTTNCGNKFAEFFFDNKCLTLMNEQNLEEHHYKKTKNKDYKFVLNFWVDDLEKEYRRLKSINIGEMTSIVKVHSGYYYDLDSNVIEITGGYSEKIEVNK